jgi:DNA-binding CsgD family transcriptional regulator
VTAEPIPAPARDDVEQALLSARAQLDAAISNHRRRSVVELPPSEDAVRATLRRLVALAREELICIPALACRPAGTLTAALAEIGRLPAAGIAVRMLCSADAMRTDAGERFVSDAETRGIHVRVTPAPLHELLMVDDRVALVHPETTGAGRRAVVAYAPAILHTLRALFTGAWQAADPAMPGPSSAAPAWDRLTREILDCLSAGYKDDAAARKLGLSVRTYRRYVAEILRDMGAASRFQAGVRAAELRLLRNAL